MEASETQKENATARLSSPLLSNKVPHAPCLLTLRYHMHGSTMGALQLAVRRSSNWTAVHQLWSTPRGVDFGDSWKTATIDLKPGAAETFQVRLLRNKFCLSARLL